MRAPGQNRSSRWTFAHQFGRILLAGSIAIAILMAVPAVSAFLMEDLQVFPPIGRSAVASTLQDSRTAIVILAAGRRSYAPEFGSQTVDALSLERLRYGALLARSTRLPILVSGGFAKANQPSLADLLADVLINEYGLMPRWREARSTNTAENAIDSAAILKREGITRIVLVTHAWHMKRARAAFVANGLTVIPAPTAFYRPDFSDLWEALVPSFAALRMSGYALHEIVGGWWYAVRYGY